MRRQGQRRRLGFPARLAQCPFEGSLFHTLSPQVQKDDSGVCVLAAPLGLELSHRLHFGQEDPLDGRAQRQIALRVNTRGHADSLKELRLKDACRHAFQCHSDIVFSDEGFIQSPGWIRKAEVC